MPAPPFGLELVQWLVESRHDAATTLLQLFTFLGEIEGYVLVVALIYVAYDKDLAFRLAVLVLVTMSLNHILKTLIANPRPFVDEGTYADKWAVSGTKAQELATEYSTPSGHAMAGSAFYAYLYASLNNSYVRNAAIAAILLTGLSRPYLGVHYLEDVLLGWALGVAIALFSLKFSERIGEMWGKRSLPGQVLIVVASSCGIWLATRGLGPSGSHAQPLAFVSYTGFLAGVVLAFPLEARWVGFDPKSSTAFFKVLRLVVSVALVFGTLLLLDELFGLLAGDTSLLGNTLRFVRYAAAGIVGFLLAPLVCVNLGLAERGGQSSTQVAVRSPAVRGLRL